MSEEFVNVPREVQRDFMREYGDEMQEVMSGFFGACTEWAKDGGTFTMSLKDYCLEAPNVPLVTEMAKSDDKTFASTITLVNDNIGEAVKYLAKAAVTAEQNGLTVNKEVADKALAQALTACANYAYAIGETELIREVQAKGYQEMANNISKAREVRLDHGEAPLEVSQSYVIHESDEMGKTMLPCLEFAAKDLLDRYRVGEEIDYKDFGKNADGSYSVVNNDAVGCPAAAYVTTATRLIADAEKTGRVNANEANALINDVSQKAVIMIETAASMNERSRAGVLSEILNGLANDLIKGRDLKESKERADWRVENEFLPNIGTMGNIAEYQRYAADHGIKLDNGKTITSSLVNDPYKENKPEQKALNSGETKEADTKSPDKAVKKEKNSVERD